MHAAFHHVNNFLKQHAGSAQRTIAFYSTSPRFAPWEWMAPLAIFLQQKDYRVVLLSTYPMEGIPPALHYFTIGAGEIVHIEGLHGIITMDTDFGPFPGDARVLAASHGHQYAASSRHYEGAAFNPAWFDGYLLNTPLGHSLGKIRELWTGLLPSSSYQRSGTRFDILACGYLRTAALQLSLRKDIEPDAICFAPVMRHHAPAKGGDRIALYGRKILHTLLQNFPEYKIIFRPTPGEFYDSEMQKIISEFKQRPRFVLDASPSKNDVFSRSAALVTDVSLISQSFAFTTLRPAISFQPWETGGDFKKAPYGGITYSFPSLVSTLRSFLKHREAMAKIIRRERDKGTCPPETAFEDFVVLFEDFLAASPPAASNSFISIPRVEPGCTAMELVERLSSFYPSVLQTAYLRGFHSGNPLMPATVVLTLYAAEPATLIPEALRHNICRFAIPKEAVPATYGEAKELGISLLKLALLQYIKAGDARGKEFCENLIEKYT